MISIVIPVYKELDSLPILFDRIKNTLNSYPYEIIVVNDYQKDVNAITQFTDKYNNLKVINRPEKQGVASAIVDGMKIASYQYICTMNADLQHPPEILPLMIEKMKNSDIVIATRYANNGRIEKWSIKRRITSKVATMIAKLIPRISNVSDPMSGFYIFDKNIIKFKLDPPRSDKVSIGFKLPVEILAKGDYKTVAEVPYTFADRKSGKSNMTIYSIYIYLKQLSNLIIHSEESNRILKFLMVGGSGAFINISILYVLTEKMMLFYVMSALIAMESAIIWNFLLNEHWTFKDLRQGKDTISVLKRGIKFNLYRTVGMVINISILFFLTEFIDIYYLLSSIMTILIVTVWNYSSSRILVWSVGGDNII